MRRGSIGINIVLFLFLFLLGNKDVEAQYLNEFGFGGGVSGYTGELSRSPFTSSGYTLGAFYRSNLSTRFSLSVGFDYGELSGSVANVKDKYPSIISDYSFNAQCLAPEVLFEINFFPYPKMKSVLNSKNITPYCFVGVNALAYSLDGNGGETVAERVNATLGVPLGVGMRWIFSDHWGIQLRFKAVKSFTDGLDGVALDNPLGFEKSGFHTKDWMYGITFMLTYSFGEDVWNCNCPGGYKRKRPLK